MLGGRAIRAQPGFWGNVIVSANHSSSSNVDDRTIEFVACAALYCCNSMDGCPTYDACAPLRAGQLCGRCTDGYTEVSGGCCGVWDRARASFVRP